jgi:hypothetical protein
MRIKFSLARVMPKLRTSMGRTGISGAALFVFMMAVFIASCSKDIGKDQTDTLQTPAAIAGTVPTDLADTVVINPVITVNLKSGTPESVVAASTITLKMGTTLVSGTVNHAGNSVSFTPAADLIPDTRYTARFVMKIKKEGSGDDNEHSWSFTTGRHRRNNAPTVISVVPANNAASVAVTIQPSVTFSEEMMGSSINSTTFTLKQGSTPVAGNVTHSDKGAKFIPAASLSAGTLYTATITTGVKDEHGNKMSSDYVWSFTTAGGSPTTDVTPPTILSCSPANSSTGVATSGKPAVTFSEAMTASTITTSTFTLKQGSTNVAGTVTYSGTTATFTPSASLAASTVYTGTISTGVKDAAGNPMAASYLFSFTTAAAAPTDVTPPTILSCSPANSSTGVATSGKPGVTFSEAMTASTITTATFTLKQGSTNVAGTVTYSGTTATFTPSAALAASTVYTGTISTGVKDAAGNPMAAAYSFSFTTAAAAPTDVTPPTVLSVVPANSATGIATSSKPAVTFSEAMTASTITTATFTLKQGSTTVAGTVAYSGTTATFTPSSALAASTVYTGTITTGVKDAAGNALASNYTWSFTTAAPVDATPPTVSSVTPANNATGIATNSKPAVTFSEAMTASTITTATFTLKQGSTTVAGTVAYSGTTATFTPSSALAASTVYTGTITTGVKDAAGNALAGNYTWSFTTAAPADVTPPTVSSVTPANSATGIATNSSVKAVFSEAMTSSTISTTTFTLKQGTTTVAGTVSYSGTTATFTPSTALSAGMVYTATITTGAKDAAGNAIASSYSWSFTTAPAVAQISFATQVFPIVQAKCMPCHGASSPSAGISLTNYTQVKAIGSKLDNSSMYSKMGVTAAEQTIIQTWLSQGSQNN